MSFNPLSVCLFYIFHIMEHWEHPLPFKVHLTSFISGCGWEKMFIIELLFMVWSFSVLGVMSLCIVLLCFFVGMDSRRDSSQAQVQRHSRFSLHLWCRGPGDESLAFIFFLFLTKFRRVWLLNLIFKAGFYFNAVLSFSLFADCVRGHSPSQQSGVCGASTYPNPFPVHGCRGPFQHSRSGLLL